MNSTEYHDPEYMDYLALRIEIFAELATELRERVPAKNGTPKEKARWDAEHITAADVLEDQVEMLTEFLEEENAKPCPVASSREQRACH